jgi:uncharacterized protein (DUF305 family)
MQTKSLLYGLIGFFIGGLIVSIAATRLNKPTSDVPTSSMTSSLREKKGDEFDAQFISHMIEHHQSAVDMASLSSQNAKHEEIKQLSREIIVAQEKEIAQMRQWQQRWGYASTIDHDKMGH